MSQGDPSGGSFSTATPRRRTSQFSFLRLIVILVPLVVVVGGVALLATPQGQEMWEQFRYSKAEAAAAKALNDRDYLALPEPPKGKVSTVSFLSKDVDDECLSQLPALYRVGTIQLEMTNVTDEQVHFVNGLQHLVCLNLSGTGVSDAGMVHLTDLPMLEALYLVDTKVGDRGLEDLAKLRTLKVLDLSGTEVTDDERYRNRELALSGPP